MRKILRALIMAFFLSIGTGMVSSARIQPGEIIKKLNADLDGNGQPELILLRRAELPFTGERLEIWRSAEDSKPFFVSDWKEIEDCLLLSSEGELKLERIGPLVLAKYIWKRRGEGTGGGHALEHITYYGYVGGKFEQVFDYVAKKSNWINEKNESPGSKTELDAAIRFEGKDRIPDIELLVTEKTEEDEPAVSGKGSFVTNVKTVRKLRRYVWDESQGFILCGEKEIKSENDKTVFDLREGK